MPNMQGTMGATKCPLEKNLSVTSTSRESGTYWYNPLIRRLLLQTLMTIGGGFCFVGGLIWSLEDPIVGILIAIAGGTAAFIALDNPTEAE